MKKYIRFKNNVFLTTDNDWKTVKKETQLDKTYNEETNQDNIFIARNKFELGNEKFDIIINELNKIRKILNDSNVYNNEDGFGLAFEVFSMAVLFNFSYTKVIKENLIIGGKDGKVDAIIFLENECRVFQIKQGVIPSDSLTTARENINEFINYGKITSANSGDLLKFCQKHSHELTDCEIKYYSISTNSTINNISPKFIFQKFIESITIPASNNNIKLSFIIEKRKGPQGHEERNFCELNKTEYFIFISAKNLLKSIKEETENFNNLETLFDLNVRGFKGKNKKMSETLKNTPKLFCLFNNGLSLLGKVVISDTKISINHCFFVNGQQTLFNLINAEKEGIDLSSVYLPLFIKDITEQEDKQAIAKFNNSQTPIKSLDLLSLDEKIRNIQKTIFEKSYNEEKDKFYLNIYSSGKKSFLQMAKKLFGENSIIKLLDFLRLNSTINTPSLLGKWKNTPTKCIDSEYVDKIPTYCDNNELINICKAISIKNEILSDENNKSKYSSSSVVLEWLLYRHNFDKNKCLEIIDKYIYKYYDSLVDNKPNNRADIFKKPNIDVLIKEIEQEYN